MPYIKKKDRDKFEIGHEGAGPGIYFGANTTGELNYCLTLVVKDYLDRKGLKYETINDILGALDGAKMEFYRRVAAQYENKKIKENGDVY